MYPEIPLSPDSARLEIYSRIRNTLAFNACSMIDWANNKPENRGAKPKVGGHQASSLSAVDLLSVLYLHFKRSQDRVALKPHAAPVLYSLAYLMDLMSEEEMGRLRELGGPQPYPTKLKDPVIVDYTTSSEALGVCATIYDAYGATYQNDNLERLGGKRIDSVYYAHCGDGELTEGQIDESLYDAGRWRLGNLVWIVDLNLQSLDRVMDDGGRLENWASAKFETNGWHVIRLRWGSMLESLFREAPGGAALRARLESLTDAQFQCLIAVGPAVARRLLIGRVEAKEPELRSLEELFRREAPMSDQEARGVETALQDLSGGKLELLLSDTGGHDHQTLILALEEALAVKNRPVAILARTVKGKDSVLAAHPENHGMLMGSAELEALRERLGVGPGRFPRFRQGSAEAAFLSQRRADCFDLSQGYRESPVTLDLTGVRASRRAKQSTGEAFQSMNLALLRSNAAPYMQFGAPDVGQTTHLGPVIRQTGVYSPVDQCDYFGWMAAQRKSSFAWRSEKSGQFHSFGIAEGNAMLWAYAFGRRKREGEGRVPLIPVVTVYDKFFERALNQLDYACYSDGRFIAVGVPSGTGLSREAGTHQSIFTPRMVMDIPGIIAYEPAFAEDVEAIYRWAIAQLWEPAGEAVYLRLTTQPLAQPDLAKNAMEGAVAGAYWVKHPLLGPPPPFDGSTLKGTPLPLTSLPYEPGENVVHLFATGRKVGDALLAADRLEEEGIHACVLNVTSWERLWREWDQWRGNPDIWDDPRNSYRLVDLVPDREVNVPLVVVGDFCPSVCEWVSPALQRLSDHRFLGPRRNSQAGDLESLDRWHRMAVEDIVQAAREELEWRRQARLA